MQAPAAVGGAAPAAFLLAMPRIVGGAAPAAAGEGATIVGVAPFFPVAAGGGATMILGGAAAACVAAFGAPAPEDSAAIVAAFGAPDPEDSAAIDAAFGAHAPADLALLVDDVNQLASASTMASFALPNSTSSSVAALRIPPISLRKMAS